MGIVTVLAIVCAGWCSAELLSTPEYMVLGKGLWGVSGEIWRCPLEAPTACELINKGSSHIVTDTLVHGEHLYASHSNGLILKCNWYGEPQCEEFHRAGAWVTSLAAADGFLYAGDEDGNILRCQFNQPGSLVYKFESEVVSMYTYDNYIYAVTNDYLSKCSIGMQVNCTQLGKLEGRRHIAVFGWGNTVITFSDGGELWAYRSNKYTKLNHPVVPRYVYNDMAIFKGNLYLLYMPGVIVRCQWDIDTPNNCTVFARHSDVSSISFVYRSHAQSAPLALECGARSSRSVFDYAEQHRARLEVRVVAGALHDARGALDTRAADAGRSGRAAVFAMAPDGRLLVSAAHGSGLVDATSLFAGAPVAGAGEMHVEAGVVTRIVACSEQYRATVALNRQVVHELHSRGYTREIRLEECVYACDRD